MKILIVGGGVAGLTLAALLYQRGEEPLVIEKAKAYDEVGYLLSLWPLGSRVLRGLGLAESFEELSEPLNWYTLNDEQGRRLHSFSMTRWQQQYGTIGTPMRADLLDLLRSYGGGFPVMMGCTVDTIKQSQDVVQVHLSNDVEDEFDLVVGADGIHSWVRTLLFGELPLQNTNWRLWNWWLNPQSISRHDEVNEFWGAGRFLGVYPARDCVACAAVLPANPGPATLDDQRLFLREQFYGYGGNLVRTIFDQPTEVASIEQTELADIKMRKWHKGRILLIGDASAAFLPTAGIGASMAMESAAVLNDELSRVDAASVLDAINLFLKRRRSRIDAMQSQSRLLLKLVTLKSRPLIAVRNTLLRHVSASQLFGSITTRMKQPI